MLAVMAEMPIEEPDPEDDKDFAVEKFEEDVFESDFESTDEEEAQREETEVGEKDVQDEEKRARKTARSRLEKATAAAHERQKATFNPTASSSQPKPKPKPKSKRTLTISLDPETGNVVQDEATSRKKRQSTRTHTVMNSSATIKRALQSEQQKALQTPKKTKSDTPALTQAELIARALDNEEGNIVEHRDYLKIEEEKRKRARVVRESISGPLVRWISKGEEVKVEVTPPPPPPPPPAPTVNPTGYSFSYGFSQNPPASGTMSYGQYTFSTTTSYYRSDGIPGASQSSTALSSSPSTSTTTSAALPILQLAPVSFSVPTPAPVQTSQPPPKPTFRTEKVNKNYLVHELDQHEKVTKPQWSETMEAVFGGHVKWEDAKVYSGKSRPLSRLRQTCPITGLQAKYLDPRTGVPFADVQAYEVLTGLISHDYVWSPELGCYTRKATSSTPTREASADLDAMDMT
ncbi:hypothetical protein V5O48_002267 [Marasmius crinis-equi]|uniref:Vps72/YL1 C-terminal domain-containing protein n=1 Tax=Marasmius crinis-equi TaxID=585013 RepID=A0ABR3FWR9_9AGAR